MTRLQVTHLSTTHVTARVLWLRYCISKVAHSQPKESWQPYDAMLTVRTCITFANVKTGVLVANGSSASLSFYTCGCVDQILTLNVAICMFCLSTLVIHLTIYLINCCFTPDWRIDLLTASVYGCLCCEHILTCVKSYTPSWYSYNIHANCIFMAPALSLTIYNTLFHTNRPASFIS